MDVSQDMKVWQQLVKDAASSGHGINISVNTAENMTINQAPNVSLQETEKPEYFTEGQGPRQLAPPVSSAECSVIDCEVIEEMFHMLQRLPEPRMANVMKLLYEAASMHDPIQAKCAEWLGIGPSAYSANLKRFGVER